MRREKAKFRSKFVGWLGVSLVIFWWLVRVLVGSIWFGLLLEIMMRNHGQPYKPMRWHSTNFKAIDKLTIQLSSVLLRIEIDTT